MLPAKKRPRPAISRAIIALDLDCFYASVAIRARPHLKDKPVVVVQKHLCVTSNYIARSRAKGAVQKMTPVSQALKKCPELVCIDGSDLTPFREASLEVITAIRAWLLERAKTVSAALNSEHITCPCQRLGFDEVFVDVTNLVQAQIEKGGAPFLFKGNVFGVTEDDEARRVLMVASQIAHDLRAHVIRQTELTICAGISDSKQLAKLAVNMHKPNDQTTFLPGKSAEYILTLSPRALMGFGHNTLEKIISWAKVHRTDSSIETVADVLLLFRNGRNGLQKLAEIVGSERHAGHLLELCRGVDTTEVIDCGNAPKSISAEDSCRSCDTMKDVHRRLTVQVSRLVSRLRNDGFLFSRRPKTLTVSYRFRGDGFVGTSRSVPMPMEIVSVCCSRHSRAIPKAIEGIRRAAMLVLEEHAGVCAKKKFDLTLLAVGASNFTSTRANNGNGFVEDISKFFSKATENDADVPSKPLVPCTESSLGSSRTGQLAPLREAQEDSNGCIKDSGSATEARCPICDKKISGDNLKQNNHIDNCLKAVGLTHENGGSKKRRKTLKVRTVDSYFARRS
ncbi:DNA polymerase Iota [Gracilaria domingensis]|nr:DNA polymerase Iota [Gracilaria domingensis]